ncbi:MAG: flagellar motor switch protein FliN [Gemmatimonadetes bacterium]|jgi:flagellar motor switch protein FliN|nr:flagellar motor switch protein FliN [Gemmatimonadota bacterium]
MAEKQKADTPSLADTHPRFRDIPVTISMVLGRTGQTLDELLSLGEQSLIELDKQVGDPIDILLNGRLIARGEVVTVGENFGVRVIELIDSREQIER